MGKAIRGQIDVRSSKKGNLRLLNKSLQSGYHNLLKRDPEELFRVTFKGHTFNALPFLLNSAGYWHSNESGGLLSLVARSVPVTKDVELEELSKDRLINYKLFQSLMPGTVGRREVAGLLYLKNRPDAIRLIYNSAIKVMNCVLIDGEMNHITYKYKDICNTQAFSFYMLVYWLLGLEKSYRQWLGAYIRRTNFNEVFDSLCPESSIHFKFISGEYSVDKLYYEYVERTFPDGSNIALREAYSNITRGSYTGAPMKDFERGLGTEEASRLLLSGEQQMNANIAYAYLHDGTYVKLSTENKALFGEVTRLKAKSERDKARYQAAADEGKQLRERNRELERQVSQLRLEIARKKTDEEALKRVAQLEEDLKAVTAEVDDLFTERLQLKQELSQKTKQIKHLSALVPDEVDKAEEQGVVSEDVPLEVMIDALRDKRIVLVGGARSQSVVKSFEDWGFTQFRQMEGNIRRVQCDCVVICTILCSHKDVRQAERFLLGDGAELVYAQSVNAELILREVYKVLG